MVDQPFASTTVSYSLTSSHHWLHDVDKKFTREWPRSSRGVITASPPNVLLVSQLTGLIGWLWIFFTEGIITVCFGVIAILFMAHTPALAKFLSDEELVIARVPNSRFA
jgi:hypothetical protein